MVLPLYRDKALGVGGRSSLVVYRGLCGLVVTHSAAGAKGPGSIPRSPEHI